MCYDIDRTWAAVIEARARGLPVKLGLEVDYVPGREDETRAILAPYPVDYLLGSVHFIDGLGVTARGRGRRTSAASRSPGACTSRRWPRLLAAVCSTRCLIRIS